MHRAWGTLNALAALPLGMAGVVGLGTFFGFLFNEPLGFTTALLMLLGVGCCWMAYSAYEAGRLIHQGWAARREARRAVGACAVSCAPLAALAVMGIASPDLYERLMFVPVLALLFLFVIDAIALVHIARGRFVRVTR